MLSFASEKLNSRIHVHSSIKDMVECEELKNLDFPKEYGGTMDYDELCEQMLNMLEDKNELFMKYYDLEIDRNLYPTKVLSFDLSHMDKNLEILCSNLNRVI